MKCVLVFIPNPTLATLKHLSLKWIYLNNKPFKKNIDLIEKLAHYKYCCRVRPGLSFIYYIVDLSLGTTMELRRPAKINHSVLIMQADGIKLYYLEPFPFIY